MADVLGFFVNMFTRTTSLLGDIIFVFGDYEVSFFDLAFAFLVMCMVIAVFWKGVRT